jgi:allantoin racemase
MRILYQLTSPMEKTVLGAAEVTRRRDFLRARAARGVEVDVWSLGDGPASIESEYEEALVVPELTRRVPRAAADGFDAVIIGCVSDPGLGALRELVSIPVVGPGMSAIHLAAQLGNRFAMLSPLEASRPRVERHVAALGFASRLAAVRGIGLSVLDVARDRDGVLERIAEIGRALVRDHGADVLVLGCMSMGFHGITDDLQKRLEIPVVNPVVAALKAAETMVALGLAHSRLAYPTPPKEATSR